MKITTLNSGYFHGLLNEANVLNGPEQLKYEGHSIEGYLSHYLQYLGSAEAKKMFTKKLTKLLQNDERYLHDVRRLPPGAPPWAQDALRKKELVYFKPEAELDQTLEHMTHYVAALENDSKSEDNDVKVFANREIAGFPKAESLDLLAKKSQEYFKRGTKKVGRSEEGLAQIHDHGDGFKWFIIKSSEALKREGKVLQNCIGSYYTPQSLERSGEAIVVMRKPNGESVVAARIANKENEVKEMKGKNNKAPVEKYMQYVIDFVNKFKLGLSSSAAHDFRRGGYFYIEGKMYTRQEAIKAFVSKDTIAKFPDGNVLVRVKTESQDELVKEIFRDLYPDLQLGYRDAPEIYELRNSENNPLVSGAVQGKKLEKIQRHRALRESLLEAVFKGRATKEFVGELIRRGIIDSINDKMARDLFWNERVQINREKGTFDPVQAETEHKDLGRKKKTVTWEKHTNDDAVAMIKQSFKAQSSHGDDEKWEPMGISTVYITKQKLVDSEHHMHNYETEAKHFALVKTKDGILIPVVVDINNDKVSTLDVGAAGDDYKRLQFIDAAAALANHEGAELSKSFAYNNGLVREKGKYETFDHKARSSKVLDDPETIKIDLTGLPLSDRLNAMNQVIVSGKIRYRGDEDEDDHEGKLHRHDTEVQLKLDYLLKGDQYARGRSLWSSPSNEDTNHWAGHETDKLYRRIFGGGEPDRMYLVMVTYGANKKHQVLLIADDQKVYEVDGTTERHEFQKYGDHDKVADQLNKFAKAEGLTFDRDSLGESEELRIYKGKIATGSMIQKMKMQEQKQAGEIGQEGEDRVNFEGGAFMNALSEDEQAQWVRRGLDERTVDGQAWAAVDKAGKYLGVIVVKSNTIQALYGPDFDWDSDAGEMVAGSTLLDMTNKQSLNPELVQYTLAAKKKFNWKVKSQAQYSVKRGSDHHDILEAARDEGEVRENPAYHKCYDLGLITTSGGSRGMKKVQLTSLGQQALETLEVRDSVNVLDLKGEVKAS
jgi:hypothetical protein